ncbi:MAG: F0F1 ATP synthase subunit B [Chloroflexota bacterium]
MDILATAGGLGQQLLAFAAEAGAEGEGGGLTINVFWIVVSAANFILFFALAYLIVLKPVGRTIGARRDRIEQGLKDADAARRDREAAADQRQAILAEARREANEILARAQRLADEARDQGVAATQAEIERRKAQADAEIEAERQRALNEVRAQVADLALMAAGTAVGETLTDQRERRLEDEFLTQVTAPAPGAADRN